MHFIYNSGVFTGWMMGEKVRVIFSQSVKQRKTYLIHLRYAFFSTYSFKVPFSFIFMYFSTPLFLEISPLFFV